MHRLTARFLLTLMLVGTLTPLALAIAAPAPHACCMRKPMHGAATPNTEFHAPLQCCGHDCCRTLTVSQWAHATLPLGTYSLTATASLESIVVLDEPPTFVASTLSARAPPQISIA